MPRLPRAVLVVILPVGLLVAVTVAATATACFEPELLRQSFETEIEIEAPVDRVWRVLGELEAYATWNPFIRYATGELREGRRITVTIQPPGRGAFEFRPTLISVKPGRELRWLGHLGIPGLFDGEHAFAIESLAENRVRVHHDEIVRGILVPFLGGMLRDTERGFHEMNQALKARAEGDTRIASDGP